MKLKTNLELVAYAEKALKEKWGYVWGTFGQVLTEELLKQKIKQYPDGVGNREITIRQHWMKRNVTDCVGLIKSCAWSDGLKVRYDLSQDFTANQMFLKATVKGSIDSIPETPGLCVWKSGHIGVYIGNGFVIEAHGTEYGVIKTPLHGPGATAWTNWCESPIILYVKPLDPITELVARAMEAGLISDGKLWADALNGLIVPSPAWIRVILERALKL